MRIRDFTPARALRGGYDVLHIHWPDKALNAESLPGRVAGAVAAHRHPRGRSFPWRSGDVDRPQCATPRVAASQVGGVVLVGGGAAGGHGDPSQRGGPAGSGGDPSRAGPAPARGGPPGSLSRHLSRYHLARGSPCRVRHIGQRPGGRLSRTGTGVQERAPSHSHGPGPSSRSGGGGSSRRRCSPPGRLGGRGPRGRRRRSAGAVVSGARARRGRPALPPRGRPRRASVPGHHQLGQRAAGALVRPAGPGPRARGDGRAPGARRHGLGVDLR